MLILTYLCQGTFALSVVLIVLYRAGAGGTSRYTVFPRSSGVPNQLFIQEMQFKVP